ncbi:MAG: hypothetical protein ACJ8AT_01995 [Hyalangium sp.]|uniref:hypothetical protein n=1 Tax=Hyalangium sp. TaxID=2028555 RepID=UPI00389AEBF7
MMATFHCSRTRPAPPSLRSGPSVLRLKAHLPSLQLVSCEGDRCLHRFTANAGGAAEPLRVHIHRPGRYVFNISHATEARRIDESFVVQAEPFP